LGQSQLHQNNLNIKFDSRPPRRKRPWEAHSKVTGKLKHLGYFETAREAALAVMNYNHANGFRYINEAELGFDRTTAQPRIEANQSPQGTR
jgi:hypothetical protein